MKVAIIGGGAAGFFSALAAKKHFPKAEVVIFEKSAKVLAKVKVSGGGRCNVTNACFDNRKLASHYPRGENYLRKAFEQFNAQSTIDWFAARGVKLHTYPDNCIFPASNDSQTIIDTFLKEAIELGVKIKMQQVIHSIEPIENQWKLNMQQQIEIFDKVIVTIGGQPKESGFSILSQLDLNILKPVPSLFTFNMPENAVRELMGNVVEKATVRIEGQKLIGHGPLLITHWGMSGPAILQLSAWGARILEEKNYQFAILVNWLDDQKEDALRAELAKIGVEHGNKMIGNLNPFPMTKRLWHFLLEKASVHPEIRWKDLGKKNVNRLVNQLLNDRYEVKGKTTFKEEFVTAGGVDLKEINVQTMEAKRFPGLFFAGEVLDIDGITGGFNFQAAWTTGYIAGKNCGGN